jgi:acetoin utilization deacetylase AcuC-like enzyme
VTVEQLSLAHDAAFVADVLACRRDNGFGNRSSALAATLALTSGAMLSAARHALATRFVAVAPCSGFHHASWARARGFCTFNGLMVTAAVLHAEGARRIGILDCDHHYGDGTEAIIEHLGARSWVRHITVGESFHSPAQASQFPRELERWLASLANCDLVLYQAGADPHVDDPLGGWLTTEQLRERDAHVFASLAALRVPVAWNLAGGYQREADGGIPKVLEIHDNTLLECARVHGVAREA